MLAGYQHGIQAERDRKLEAAGTAQELPPAGRVTDETEPEPRHKPIWPPESGAAVRRFHGQPHAKLFSFLGRKVRTPVGPGTLLQVLAERVTVLLDSELSQCSFFQPAEIEPVTWEP
jgi:hypothetical protein